MTYAREDEEEPPALRRLRRMVMVLIVVLILGIVTIAATIVIRLGFGGGKPGAEPVLSKDFFVPRNVEILATGQGRSTLLLVTRDAGGRETLSVYDSRTGALLSTSIIKRCETVPCPTNTLED